jgi:hypothetical protein
LPSLANVLLNMAVEVADLKVASKPYQLPQQHRNPAAYKSDRDAEVPRHRPVFGGHLQYRWHYMSKGPRSLLRTPRLSE